MKTVAHLTDVATGIQLGQVDCVSEVTGIQFNPQLKQVATSHHTLFHAIENNTVTGLTVRVILSIHRRTNKNVFKSLIQVYGSDSSVQLWQFSSNNRLNPLLQLGRNRRSFPLYFE